MNTNEIVVDGTLRPDGTLELDHKPVMAPGRVQVVLRREPDVEKPRESWWAFIQQARADLERTGADFMDDEQVAAHIAFLRESDPTDDLLAKSIQHRRASE